MYGKLLIMAASAALVVSTPANAEGWQTSFSAGIAMTSTNFDLAPLAAAPAKSEPSVGGFVGFEGTGSAGGMSVSFDGFIEYLGDTEAVFLTGPLHSGVVGVHAGRDYEAGYFGAFAGLGFFDSYLSASPETGTIAGLEGVFGIGAGNAFVQLGYARAVSDSSFNEFIGPVARVGVSSDLPSGLSLSASIETGKNTGCVNFCFYSGEPYYEVTLEMEKDIAPGYGLVGGVSHFQPADWMASSNSLFIGLRTAVGSGKKTPSTPRGAFKMTGWAVAS